MERGTVMSFNAADKGTAMSMRQTGMNNMDAGTIMSMASNKERGTGSSMMNQTGQNNMDQKTEKRLNQDLEPNGKQTPPSANVINHNSHLARSKTVVGRLGKSASIGRAKTGLGTGGHTSASIKLKGNISHDYTPQAVISTENGESAEHSRT